MTLQELYQSIGGDYEQALRVLRMDKLLDKHVRKFTKSGVVETLLAAGETMDPTQLFESAHAVKGICANLGLNGISDAAAEITEEFRPGNPRSLSDGEVAEKLRRIAGMYRQTVEGIKRYEEG
jgi:HPt (histidine-containing phosphotransfer) domain-containing protein